MKRGFFSCSRAAGALVAGTLAAFAALQVVQAMAQAPTPAQRGGSRAVVDAKFKRGHAGSLDREPRRAYRR